MLNKNAFVLFAAVSVVCFAVASTMDLTDEVQSEMLYCEMTALFQETQGDQGWIRKDITEIKKECRSH